MFRVGYSIPDADLFDAGHRDNVTRLSLVYLQAFESEIGKYFGDLMRIYISDLLPLSNLTNLTWLRLNKNQISDISPLVENSGLGTGDEIWLEDNNLDLSEGSEDMGNIRALEGRGVIVHY